jgi:hypothetical protein
VQFGDPPKALRSGGRYQRDDADVPEVAVEVGAQRIGMGAECAVRTCRPTAPEERDDQEKDGARKREDEGTSPSTGGSHQTILPKSFTEWFAQ